MNPNEELTQSMLAPRKVLGYEKDVCKFENEEKASLELNRTLIEDYCMCETPESKARKEEVLALLNQILLEWENEIRTKLNLLTTDTSSHILVIPYGSYRFGVSTPGGDLDLLVAIPKVIFDKVIFREFREEYWNKLLGNKLKARQEVEQLNIVKTKNAIINLEIRGTPIDLSLTSISSTENINDRINAISIENPGEDLVEHLKPHGSSFGMPDQSDSRQLIEAFAGVQNCQLILRSFRQPGDTEAVYKNRLQVYMVVLRAVKLFCKRKCIDSNKLGYMAGITLAILVAKALQWFPNLTPVGLLYRFFQFYGKFIRFGKANWIILEEYKIEALSMNRIKNERAMHVLTPSPTMPTNSTFNTKECNLKVFKFWMQFGFETLSEVVSKSNSTGIWASLFSDGSSTIFGHYDHFLEMRVLYSSYTVKGWVHACEAKFKVFLEKFENSTSVDYDPFPIMYPYGKKFPVKDTTFKYAVSFVFPFKKCDETRELLNHIVSYVKENVESGRNTFYKDNGINQNQHIHPEINLRILYRNKGTLENLLQKSKLMAELAEEKDEASEKSGFFSDSTPMSPAFNYYKKTSSDFGDHTKMEEEQENQKCNTKRDAFGPMENCSQPMEANQKLQKNMGADPRLITPRNQDKLNQKTQKIKEERTCEKEPYEEKNLCSRSSIQFDSNTQNPPVKKVQMDEMNKNSGLKNSRDIGLSTNLKQNGETPTNGLAPAKEKENTMSPKTSPVYSEVPLQAALAGKSAISTQSEPPAHEKTDSNDDSHHEKCLKSALDTREDEDDSEENAFLE